MRERVRERVRKRVRERVREKRERAKEDNEMEVGVDRDTSTPLTYNSLKEVGCFFGMEVIEVEEVLAGHSMELEPSIKQLVGELEEEGRRRRRRRRRRKRREREGGGRGGG